MRWLLILLFPVMCHAQDTLKFDTVKRGLEIKVDADSIAKWSIIDFKPFEGIGTLSKPVKIHRWLQTGILTTSVITGALADGMNSRTLYTPGHLLASVSVLSLLSIPFTGKVDWKMPVSYILLRYALWDICYNIGAHRKWNYEGGKNYYDESIGRMPFGVLNATKIISFGFVIYLNRK